MSSNSNSSNNKYNNSKHQHRPRRYYNNNRHGNNQNRPKQHNKRYNNNRYKEKIEPDLSSLIIDTNLDADTVSTITENQTTGTTTTQENVTKESSSIKIAVEGCCHGELNTIYKLLQEYEIQHSTKIDLLLICGDFQSIRNTNDLQSIAVPDKYKNLGDFHEYYNGIKIAPITTIFIGGNHECSYQLQELFYGGWVCPNIYYLGHANIIKYGSVNIGGISGIYKEHDYNKDFYERPPYNNSTLRSIYHVRKRTVEKLALYRQNIDVFLSHDWPNGIEKYGNVGKLIRIKPFFKEEINDNCLGNPKTMDLLVKLQPTYWFSAHLHVAFEATYIHSKDDDDNLTCVAIENSDDKNSDNAAATSSSKEEEVSSVSCNKAPKVTYFRSLDKCLPKRKFLRIMSLPNTSNKPLKLEYDLEWLAILQKTHASKNIESISEDDIMNVKKCFENEDYSIPNNFEATVPFQQDLGNCRNYVRNGDPQTDLFLKRLGLNHNTKITIPYTPMEILTQVQQPPPPPPRYMNNYYDQNATNIEYKMDATTTTNNNLVDEYDENAIDLDEDGEDADNKDDVDVNAIDLDEDEEDDNTKLNIKKLKIDP